MATVKKNSKINLYKFVAIKEPKANRSQADKVARSIAPIVKSFNGIGSILNTNSEILQEIRDTQYSIFKTLEKSISKDRFTPIYNLPEAVDDGGSSGPIRPKKKKPVKGFLEGLFGLLKDIFIIFGLGAAIKWLSDEENQQLVIKTLEVLAKIVEGLANFFTKAAKGAIEGLWDLLCNEEANWFEKFGGFVKGFVGLGAALLAIRWLKNPLKLLKDFKGGFNFFKNAIFDSTKALKGRLTKAGIIAAGVAATAWGVSQVFGGDDKKKDSGGGNNDSGDSDEEMVFKRGGKIPQRALGGFITGPQSGYPVSLDGGKSTAFIGHGTEYVAQKSNGGFVVPIDTPATKNNPNLMGNRITEANRMGFDLSGMFDNLPGYARGGKTKPTPNTSSEPDKTKGLNKEQKGGGEAAVIAAGRAILKKGFTVAEHPNFKKNNYTGGGANTGKGFVKEGRQRVGGHSAKSAHYRGLAIDVTDWRPGDWKGRTRSLAQSVFDNRKKLKATQIIHDPWGSWFAGESKKGKAVGGHPTHLHIAFAPGPGSGKLGTSGGGGGGGNAGIALSGESKKRVGGDTEFLKKVKSLSAKLKVHPADMLGLMASESGLDPKARNRSSGATGLIQFMPSTARGLGTTTDKLYNMSRSEQMVYVEKYLYPKLKNVKGGVTAGHLYTAVFLPAFAGKPANYVVAKRGGFSDSWGHHPASWYAGNAGLDLNKDGSITIAELGERIQKKKKSFGISGSGSVGSGDADVELDEDGNPIGDEENVDSLDIESIAQPAVPIDPRVAFEGFAKAMLGESFTGKTAEAGSSGASGVSAGSKPASPGAPEPGDAREKVSGGAAPAAAAKGADAASPSTTSPPGALAAGQRPDKSLSNDQWRVQQSARAEASAKGLVGAERDRYIAGRVMGQISAPTPNSASMVSQTNQNVQTRSNIRSQATMATAQVAQIAEIQNAQTKQVAAQAAAGNAAVAKAASSSTKPTVVGGGGTSQRSLIQQLNSSNNLISLN